MRTWRQRTLAMPASSASAFTSTIVTGMPLLTKHIEMPPPIVPAPITVACAVFA